MRYLATLFAALTLLLSGPAAAQTSSSMRSGDPQAANSIAAPTGSGSVFVPKVMVVNASGTTATGAAATEVQGNVASGATDSGNPAKVGCKYNLAPPSVSDGQRVDCQATLAGETRIFLTGANATGTDGVSNAALASMTLSGGAPAASVRPLPTASWAYNGATLDEVRSNINTAALITASGATTSQTGSDQTNYSGRCITVVLDMTSAGTGSVTLTIQGKDSASGKYFTLLAGAAVTTNSTNPYWVCPGAPTTANVSAALPLPRTWRVITTANNANATTYTVGASITN